MYFTKFVICVCVCVCVCVCGLCGEMGKGREVLAVCSDKNMGIGITMWDMDTGDRVMHIPTCASAPRGLLCLKDQFLVASQVSKHKSVGGGSIFTWPLNKPSSPLRSYPLEAIGPLCCTKDGMYLAGGSPSGNAYIWEVSSGTLLKTWHAHRKSLKCMSFSADDSLLVSSSDDGMICVWSVIGLLDADDIGSSWSLLHYSIDHKSSITGLLITSSTFLSSSLDATIKAWELVSGRVIQTREYPVGITAAFLDPAEQLLFSGSVDGTIYIEVIHIDLLEDPLVFAEDQPTELKGHNGSITALNFSALGLISASEDCTVCLWNVTSGVITRRFNHQKGPVTNLVLISRSSLTSASNHQRASNQFRVSLLEKCPQPAKLPRGILSTLSSCSSSKDNQTSPDAERTNSLDHQILEMQQGQTPMALQIKVDASTEDRMWATRMARQVMGMNKSLQSRLLDMMQVRLCWASENDPTTARKIKKLKIDNSPPEGEMPLQSSQDQV